MSSYGISPLGTELGPLGGPGLITVLGVLPSTNNSMVVVWDRVPETLDPLSFYSATNPDNYSLEANDPSYLSSTGLVVPKGMVVPRRAPRIFKAEQDAADLTQIELYTDTALEPGVVYSLAMNSRIQGANQEVFAGEDTWTLQALELPARLRSYEALQEQYRDFAFGFGAEASPAFSFDTTGDISLQNARDSLRKRIYRRLFTRTGDFAWTSNYGVGLSMKALLKSGQTQLVADRAREQILKEPDVQDAAVQVSITRASQGAFVEVRIIVRQVDQQLTNLQFMEPLDV